MGETENIERDNIVGSSVMEYVCCRAKTPGECGAVLQLHQ